MQDCKHISTPFPINCKLFSSLSPSNEVKGLKCLEYCMHQ